MKKQSKANIHLIERQFKEHYALLCMVAFSIIKDRDIAKDIVQDFFVSYWQRRETVSIKTSFKSYAAKAVKNLSLMYLEKIHKNTLLLRDLQVRSYVDPKPVEKTPNGHRGILELLNQLPEARRKIFISRVVDGLSYSEIAENNGISINTVKTQMKRAYAFLRKNAMPTTYLLLMFFL